MFIRYLAFALLILTSASSNATNPAAMFETEGVAPSDQIFEFAKVAIIDCKKLVEPKTTRLGLCAITLSHYENALELYQQKESFLPEDCRTLLPSSSRFISLLKTDGTPHSRICPENLQQQVFNNAAYSDVALRQIALSMVFHHFKLLCQVHYLNEGGKHIKGFNDYRNAEGIAQGFRYVMTTEKDSDLPLKASDEDVLDAVLVKKNLSLNSSSGFFFHLLTGIAHIYFMELNQDRSGFVLPELDFCNGDLQDRSLKSKSYIAFQLARIADFKLKLYAREMDILAPLPDISWRRHFLNSQIAAGRVNRMVGESQPAAIQSFAEVSEDEKSLLALARLANAAAVLAAEDKVAPLESQIRSLEKAIEILQETIASNEAEIKNKEGRIGELQRKIIENELLEEERSGKVRPKHKEAKSELTQLTEKLKIKQGEINALNGKVRKLQDEKQENQKIIGKLRGNTDEFLAMYNRQNDIQRLMKEELQKLARDLKQLQEFANECEEERLARTKESEALKADNDDLRNKLTLIEKTHEALEKDDGLEKNDHLENSIHQVTAALAEAAKTRAQLEAENIALVARNDELTEVLLRAEKSGEKPTRMGLQMVSLQIDNERLYQEALHYRGMVSELKLKLHMLEQKHQAEHANAALFYNHNVQLTQQLTLSTSQLFITTQQRDAECQLRLKLEKEVKELKDAAGSAEGSSN